jgi:hypothetical protein
MIIQELIVSKNAILWQIERERDHDYLMLIIHLSTKPY